MLFAQQMTKNNEVMRCFMSLLLTVSGDANADTVGAFQVTGSAGVSPA
jgi:hypothetical protein